MEEHLGTVGLEAFFVPQDFPLLVWVSLIHLPSAPQVMGNYIPGLSSVSQVMGNYIPVSQKMPTNLRGGLLARKRNVRMLPPHPCLFPSPLVRSHCSLCCPGNQLSKKKLELSKTLGFSLPLCGQK